MKDSSASCRTTPAAHAAHAAHAANAAHAVQLSNYKPAKNPKRLQTHFLPRFVLKKVLGVCEM